MVKCPFAGCKGIWEFSEWLRFFLAYNVYGSGWSTSRIGRFNPGYIIPPNTLNTKTGWVPEAVWKFSRKETSLASP